MRKGDRGQTIGRPQHGPRRLRAGWRREKPEVHVGEGEHQLPILRRGKSSLHFRLEKF